MELLITKLNFIYASSDEGDKMKDAFSEQQAAFADMANNTMANWRIHPSELRNRRPLPGATNCKCYDFCSMFIPCCVLTILTIHVM
jgi:hypothetical protein